MYPWMAAWRLSFLLLLYRPWIVRTPKVRKSRIFKRKNVRVYPSLGTYAFGKVAGVGPVSQMTARWGNVAFSRLGGVTTLPLAQKSTKPALRPQRRGQGLLHLGSAARNARDAKSRERFPASLASLASLARYTAPPPAAAHCCGSCEKSVPAPVAVLWSSSSAALIVWVQWYILRSC